MKRIGAFIIFLIIANIAHLDIPAKALKELPVIYTENQPAYQPIQINSQT